MKRYRFLAFFFALASALTTTLSASITLNLSGAVLSNSTGTALPNGGLVLLVASTTNSTFATPSSTSSTLVGSMIADDDLIIGFATIDSAAASVAGGFTKAFNITFTGNLNAGDPLQLYWFPTLTSTSTTIGAGVSYGTYRTDAIATGSDIGWVVPADGTTNALSILTVAVGGTVANTAGQATLTTDGSAVAAPSITSHPSNQTVTAGSAASFSVTATGTGLSYQWRKDGSNIAGATSATYSIASAVAGDAGTYSVVVSNTGGSATSNNATLTVNAVVVAPSITTQPDSLTVNAGAAASFTVAATGTSLSYQWKKDGNDIAGATAATYSIGAATAGNAGSYTVVVSNSANSVTSSAATLTVVAAPVIVNQPAAQSVGVGSSATFNVTATGTSLTYQWRKDGNNIAGATNATYSIPATAAGDAGSYTVVVTSTVNGVGNSVTSSAAALTVVGAPAITTQPVSQTIVTGAAFNVSVTATGSGLSYQWRKDGNNIAGATNATYSIGSVAAGNAGSYTVVVSNIGGNVTSSAAVLSVIPAFPAPVATGYGSTATGGAAGSNVLVTTAADFRTQAESNSAAIITVSGTLNLGATKVAVKSNKTIQGLDANATLSGNLELASGVTNVIVRGVTITNPAGEGITLLGATNVFITHVTFIDCSDTLLRVAAGSDNVTVSWSEFTYTTGHAAARRAALIGASTGETKALRVTLANNLWSDRVDQQMPDSTWGHVHQFSNYFNTGATASTSGTVIRANAQLLSERNQYTGIATPLTKTGGGLIRTIGNAYTGATVDASTDPVFTPTYAYALLAPADIVTQLNTNAGNTAGAASSAPNSSVTASITGSTSVTVGSALTLTAASPISSVTGYQWRLNNADIAGATSSTYTVASAQTANAGIYTVVSTNGAGTSFVSAPVTIAVNAAPPPPPANSGGGGGGGAPSTWFLAALAALAGVRRLMKKN